MFFSVTDEIQTVIKNFFLDIDTSGSNYLPGLQEQEHEWNNNHASGLFWKHMIVIWKQKEQQTMSLQRYACT